MTDDRLLEHARRLWADLAGAPVGFKDSEIEVAVSPRSLLCPAGWVGIVGLGNAVIATTPDEDAAEVVRRALSDLPVVAMTDPAVVGGRLPVRTPTSRAWPRSRHRRSSCVPGRTWSRRRAIEGGRAVLPMSAC